MAPRDRNFLQFVPPNLRPALSEAGRVGYNILDNIIGYDDNYDTTGELLARSLREDPRGTLGSLAGGLYEGVKTAVTEPVQTARNVADEFTEAFLRLREPLPEFASREDIAQRTSDLSILGAIIPGLGTAARGMGATGQAIARAAPGRRDYDPFDDQDLINELLDNMDTDLIDSVGIDPAVAVEPAPTVDPAGVDTFQQTPFDPAGVDIFSQTLPAPNVDGRRAALVAALGGEENYSNMLDGPFGAVDFMDEANNLQNFVVLERPRFGPDAGVDEFTIGELAAMNPDSVRALAADASYIQSPEIIDMLADMTQQELAEITGLPIQTYAGAWNPNLPPPPADIDIDLGPDMDQIAAGADPFGDFDPPEDWLDDAALNAGPNPWTNVQGAEDLAANFVPAPPFSTDPFRGLPGSRILNETAPAAAIADANPYMPTDTLQVPQTWASQGVAGLYSRSQRASGRLGQPQYSDIESLRKELQRQGAAPMELNYQLGQIEEAMADGPVSREEIQRFFSDFDTGLEIDRTLEFAGGYMPPGGRNATSTVYYHPEGRDSFPAAKAHFPDYIDQNGNVGVPLFHSRAAQYDLGFPDGGTTHHVAEIQSDYGQFRQTLPTTPEQKAEMQRRAGVLEFERTNGLGLTDAETNELKRLNAALNFGGLRDEFDAQFDAPYVRRENDWVDAAVRQNILDAVNSGSDWITFGNGAQARRHIGMPEGAAESFYNNRVPKRVEDVLRRFANQAGIDSPNLETLPFVDGDDVRGFRITPEFREAILRNGLPSYRFGGIVSLMRK